MVLLKDIKTKNCKRIFHKQSVIMNCLLTKNKHVDLPTCSDKFVKKLELATGLKFKDNDGIVNGYVHIDHGLSQTTRNKTTRPHEILVMIYEKTELPNEFHETTLQKPSKMPTEKQCEDCLT